MAKELRDIIDAFKVEAARDAADAYEGTVDYYRERCQSPIEEALLAGLCLFSAVCPESFCFSKKPVVWPLSSSDQEVPVKVYMQAAIGQFAADFLICIKENQNSDLQYLVVECDGHQFHERTKEQAARDRSRDRWMVGKNIVVVRFTGSEIWADPFQIAREIYGLVSKIGASRAA
jgi:very-short-patch-repair endonuclease